MAKGQKPRGGVRPAGGFVFISVVQLCRAWEAYQQRAIRLADLRAWFACQEMVARRCRLGKSREARFTIEELHRLVGGVGGRHTRASLRRLEAADLLRWAGGELSFIEEPAGTVYPPGLEQMLAMITNHRRKVPVPRRVLRFLAGGAKKAVIATALGHLLRCLYYRGGSCSARGTCKSSWVAEVFDINVRDVKAARKHLVELGWLRVETAPQWRRNRFGATVTVNLAWSRTETRGREPRRSPTTETPPPRAQNATELPPPESDEKLLAEYKNQEPALRGPAGVQNEKRGGEENAPTLKHVVRADLDDVGRLLTLFAQAVTAGQVDQGEAGQLRFVAAAEHAKAVGSTNPCGLFAQIVRRKLWHVLTQADEDHAARRLKRHLYGPTGKKNRRHTRHPFASTGGGEKKCVGGADLSPVSTLLSALRLEPAAIVSRARSAVADILG